MATVRVKVIDAVWLPETPVMVTVDCPRAAALVAEIVITLVPAVGFGENVAVTLLGRPEAERVTLPVKPYWLLTHTYPVVEEPWPTVNEL